ncbi:sulfotransferase family protein [Limimaricola pyoseonensis]|uniref:Sulfotransferase family protein n=1 Tax=Limimaricola pyoseonensis TaxID=521013 RepID=A0A1G7KIK3_9RHOB|nr:sulfotransferase [Limimaricola pyoseonensis]SDF36921.1 Sulfotransferase family protein [Limimaricola pyoseonensis]
MSPAGPGEGRTAIVVLGPHRSGTSLLAGILAKLGCDLPRTLMPDTQANPKGYFESTHVMRLNDRILASLGTDWRGLEAIDRRALDRLARSEFARLAAETLGQEFAGAARPVLKDPRICLLTRFWAGALGAAGYPVAYVHTCRDPLEVAQSLLGRDGIPLEAGLRIWMRHVLEAEAATRGSPRAFTSYEGLMRDWRGQVAHLRDGLGLPMLRPDAQAEAGIDAFVSGGLHRHRSGLREMLRSDALPGHVIDTCWILERFRQGEFAAADLARLDDMRAALDAEGPGPA